MLVWAPLPDGSIRLVAAVDDPPATPDLPYMQALLDTRGPTRQHSRINEVVWGSRFRIHHRVADSFRAGPVLLAGDAGHVHSPAGGQGMNLGLQDAVALGEAIADALRHGSDLTLDRYAAERRPVAREVVHFASRGTRLATAPSAQLRAGHAVSRADRPPPDGLAAVRPGVPLRATGGRDCGTTADGARSGPPARLRPRCALRAGSGLRVRVPSG